MTSIHETFCIRQLHLQSEPYKTENNIAPPTWNSSTKFRSIKHNVVYE